MAEATWTSYGTWATALSTELDSLTGASGLAVSSAIDNSTNRDLFMDVMANLATVDLSGEANPSIYVWLLARGPNGNFEDGGSSVEPERAPDKILALRKVNGPQKVLGRMAMLTPDQCKILVKNASGATWAADGNYVKYATYGQESA